MHQIGQLLAAQGDVVWPGIAGAVAGGIAAALLSIVLLKSAQRSPPHLDSNSERLHFNVPKVVVWIVGGLTLICFMLSIAALVVGILDLAPNARERAASFMVSVMFGVGSIISALYTWDVRHWSIAVDDAGLLCTSVWHGTRRFEWDDITSIGYNALADWFVIRTSRSGSFRIPRFVSSGRILFEAIRKQKGDQTFTKSAWNNLSRL